MKPARENSSKSNNSDKTGAKRPPQGQQSSGQQNKGSQADGNSTGKKEGRRDSRNNRRWRKNRYRDNNRNKDRNKQNETGKDQDNTEQKKNRVILKCDICGKDIKEISSAIGSGESNMPVHFDCMVEKLKKENPLQADERIVYLGAGNFGVVKQEKNKPPKNFTIVKKFEVENRDEKPAWRIDQDRVK